MKIRLLICILGFLAPLNLRAGDFDWTQPIDPRQQTDVAFGTYSHWLQPWRGYLETVPAAQFLNGLGIVLNNAEGEDPGLTLQMCAKYGIKQVRLEIGWGSFDYDDEAKLHNAPDITKRLLACKANGLRPLILLNGHHGVPCPLKFFSRTVTADAKSGTRELTLDKTDDLVPGHSGFNAPNDYLAAEFLVVRVEGKKVTLSQPWPANVAAGTQLQMATLKYAPFSDPATDEGKATLEGWKRYVRNVATLAATTLGTHGSADLGFDLEIWNEMSFGSNFVDQNLYYNPPLGNYNPDGIYLAIVRATADAVEAEPALFAGVRLENGFSNTLPWPASSEMPARVTALSHHPYSNRKIFPKDTCKGTAINALGQPDTSGFTPAYQENFPEYFASALQTETLVRDASPITTDIYGTKHGRFARPGNPCWCWITEVNYAPGDDGVQDSAEALRLKAKAITRYYCFFLQKGVERVYLYAVGANDPKKGNLELGVLKQEFVNRTMTDKSYPADDAPWTSPALTAVGRIAGQMRDGLDPNLTQTRALQLLRVEDTHNAKQFEGDPADLRARPPLYDRDVFAFLPFQVNARKFVIPYYVATRDILHDLPPENFTVTIKGLMGQNAKITAYDPIRDERKDVHVVSVAGDEMKLELTATDSPILLEVEE
jgi:hypothetical protein